MKLAIIPLLALALTACSSRPTLPSYGVVPDFKLTDQAGNPFDSRQELDGKVWLASFIFTTCNGPCPRMSAQFKKIREQSKRLKDFRLVSFTIDPVRDTPAALAAYARAFGAEPSYWAFLTGEPAEINRLSWDTFHLAKLDGTLEDGTKFVLIDRKGRIRGFYDSRDDGGIPGLLADIQQLLDTST